MHHLQFTADQPIARVYPKYRRQRLREKVIVGVAAADMRQFMVEYLPTDRIMNIGAFLPEQVLQEREGSPMVLDLD